MVHRRRVHGERVEHWPQFKPAVTAHVLVAFKYSNTATVRGRADRAPLIQRDRTRRCRGSFLRLNELFGGLDAVTLMAVAGAWPGVSGGVFPVQTSGAHHSFAHA